MAEEYGDPNLLPDDDYQKGLQIDRYVWAAERLRGARTANAACGTNYGSVMLQKPGREVVGFDLGEEQAKLSRERGYGEVVVVDIEAQTFEGFDSLVCVETLEHLHEPWVFLQNLAPSVRELILTTPIVPTKNVNPYHLHDFSIPQVMTQFGKLGWYAQEVAFQRDPGWNAGRTPMNILVHAVRGVSFAVSIAHAPHLEGRKASFERMLSALGTSPLVSHLHVESAPAPPHVWSEAQWRAAVRPDATHGVFLNDDLVPCSDFWGTLEAAIRARPNEMLSLFANPKNSSKVTGAWCRTHDGLIGNAYVLPAFILRSFLEWREKVLVPGAVERRSEDQLLNVFAMWSGRDIYHTVPSLVAHDASVPSCYGNKPVPSMPPDGVIRSFRTSAPHLGRYFKGNHWDLIGLVKPEYRRIERAYEIERAPW